MTTSCSRPVQVSSMRLPSSTDLTRSPTREGVILTGAPGFRLDSGTPPSGWELDQVGRTLTFTGGLIPANTPGLLFGFKGEALASGRMLFPIDTHSPDGTVMHYAEGAGSRN